MKPSKQQHYHCDHRARSIGPSRKGFRRYRCVVCGHTWTSDEPIGVKAPVVLGPVHAGCTAPSRSHGKMPDGRPRWKCPDCGKRWVETHRPRARRDPRKPIALHQRWRKANRERWLAMVAAAVQRWRRRKKNPEI